MPTIENMLDAGPSGSNVTRANLDATGDQPDHLFINNSVVNGGNSSVQYSNDLTSSGVPMCINIAGGSGLTYLRYDPSGLVGDRFVMRRGFYLDGNYEGVGDHGVLQMRLDGSVGSGCGIRLDERRPRLVTGPTSAPGSINGPALPEGVVLWLELAVTPASSEGAEDGVLEYRVTDASGVELSSQTVTDLDILSSAPTMVNFGGGRGEGTTDYMWGIQFGALEEGWWGAPGVTEVLGRPTLTLVSDNAASSQSANDREVTVSWPAIPNASGYRALTATHQGTNYTTHEEDVESPYTFEGVTGAPIRVAIQATTD